MNNIKFVLLIVTLQETTLLIKQIYFAHVNWIEISRRVINNITQINFNKHFKYKFKDSVTLNIYLTKYIPTFYTVYLFIVYR